MDVFEFRGRGESRLAPEIEDLAQVVIGAAIEVHEHLGPGLPESLYRNALSHEFDLRGIPHTVEQPLPVYYKGKEVGKGRMDIVVAEKIILELKSVECLTEVHRAQCIAYLQTTGLQLALLINFNVVLLKDGIKRVILTR